MHVFLKKNGEGTHRVGERGRGHSFSFGKREILREILRERERERERDLEILRERERAEE